MTAAPARGQFEEILDHVPDAIVVQDAEGRLVHANRAAVEMLGSPTLEALLDAASPATLAERFTVRDEAGRELPWSRLPGPRALLGEDDGPLTVRWRPAGEATGPERWSRIKARPLRDADGTVRLAISVLEDITEIKLAELGHRFLAEAGRVLASSLDLDATLRRVAGLAVPEIADWCVIDIATRRGFDRVAVVHQDPAKLALAEELMRSYPPDPDEPRGVPEVLRTGVAELYPVVSDDLLRASATDERHLELLRSVGMVSAMVVPLRGRDEVLGAVTLVSAEAGRPFGSRDLAVAEELGRRGATAIENARLYRQRSEIARVLQQSLLPPELPEVERIESAAVFRPAGDGVDVGGDFYDLFPTSEDRWYAVIGDVCGKGPAAAAVTALARYTIRAAAVRRRSPAAILRWLNETMLRQRERGQPFCTLTVTRIDVAQAAVRVVACSAGHPLPRVLRVDGRVEALGRTGTLLGVTRDVRLEDRSATLAVGDTLLLYTDGLTEARAPGVVWDEAALDRAVIAAAGGGAQDMLDALAAAALGAEAAPPRDDLAMLALRVLPAAG